MVMKMVPTNPPVHTPLTPLTPSSSSVPNTFSVAHERLAIVDPLSGNQPLYSQDRSLVCTVNGEIYNHEYLAQNVLKNKTPFRTRSDCEIIVHLFKEIGVETASMLDGDFAFVIVNEKTGEIYAARDAAGVNSLYIGRGGDGSIWFSSEVSEPCTGSRGSEQNRLTFTFLSGLT